MFGGLKVECYMMTACRFGGLAFTVLDSLDRVEEVYVAASVVGHLFSRTTRARLVACLAATLYLRCIPESA